jgi:hypothetical protein
MLGFCDIVRAIVAPSHAGSFISAALFCQGIFSPKRNLGCNCARNNIAHFPRRSDQQAKLAEDQMSFFEVGCSGRLGHVVITLVSGPRNQLFANFAADSLSFGL